MGGGGKAPADNSYQTELLRQEEAARQREYDRVELEKQRVLDQEKAQRERDWQVHTYEQQRKDEEAAYTRTRADQDATEQRLAQQRAAETASAQQATAQAQALARQQQLEDQARAEQQAASARAQEEARAAQQLITRGQSFQANTIAAENEARRRAAEAITKRGLDPSLFGGDIENAIYDQRSKVPTLADNVSSYYNSDFVGNIISTAQDQRRRDYKKSVDQNFATGFDTSLLSDTADDATIGEILTGQRQQAQTAIDRARARGNLDDTGVSAALTKLGQMEQAGRATANTLGGAVLQTQRERLRGIADTARNAASSYELGDAFDVGSYLTQRDQTLGSINENLGGEVRNALNGQNFFNLDEILGTAGAAQGAVNPTVATPATALDQAAERERLRNTQRGLGTGGGVF